MERMICGFREIKLAAGDSAMTFGGYGAVFENVDSYGDAIAPGAFAETLQQAKASGIWPAMLEQHGGWGVSASDMTPIGVWTSLEEDSIGLKVEGKLAPTTRGQEMHALMKMDPRPAINGLSIGFVPIKWRNRSAPEEPRRTLEAVKLLEISPVTFPANSKARVQSVKAAAEIEDLSELESFLREVGGFPRSEAKALVNRMLGIARREVANSGQPEEMRAIAEALSRRQALLVA